MTAEGGSTNTKETDEPTGSNEKDSSTMMCVDGESAWDREKDFFAFFAFGVGYEFLCFSFDFPFYYFRKLGGSSCFVSNQRLCLYLSNYTQLSHGRRSGRLGSRS